MSDRGTVGADAIQFVGKTFQPLVLPRMVKNSGQSELTASVPARHLDDRLEKWPEGAKVARLELSLQVHADHMTECSPVPARTRLFDRDKPINAFLQAAINPLKIA